MKPATFVNRTAFIALLLCLGSAVYAQTEKGRIQLGGSSKLTFVTEKSIYRYQGEQTGTVRYNEFSFTPFAGYYIMDNLAVNLEAELTSGKTTTETSSGNDDETKTFRFHIGPNINYYLPVGEQLRPYVVVAGGYSTTGAGSDENKFSGLFLGAGVGASYFVNKSSSVDLQLNYSHYSLRNKAEKDYKSTTNQFFPALGFTLFF